MITAGLLAALGRALVTPGAGQLAALLFLFLADPSFQRLAGVAVRTQCETFIGALVTGGFLLLAWSRDGRSHVFAAGLLFGAAAAFKYNAAAYAVAGLFAMWTWRILTARAVLSLVAGSAVVPTVLLLVFLLTGTVGDLYDSTIMYNLQYSGETDPGAGHFFILYLVTFPIGTRASTRSGCWAARAARCCCASRGAIALARRAGLGCGGLPCDRRERQPRATAVFRPGMPGAGARRRVGWTRWRVCRV